jgi:hypothetical protein
MRMFTIPNRSSVPMAAGQTVPHVRFRVVLLLAAEPLKPHAVQPADIAQSRILADWIVAALARQE